MDRTIHEHVVRILEGYDLTGRWSPIPEARDMVADDVVELLVRILYPSELGDEGAGSGGS